MQTALSNLTQPELMILVRSQQEALGQRLEAIQEQAQIIQQQEHTIQEQGQSIVIGMKSCAWLHPLSKVL